MGWKALASLSLSLVRCFIVIAMPTRRFGRIALAQLLAAGCAVVFGACVLIENTQAQPGYVPPPTPLPPPVFNPSAPYTVPGVRETPVSPGLSSRLPDSSFCSVFDLGPCFPQFLPPIGQDLRLTIISSDDDDSAHTPNAGAKKSVDDTDKTAREKSLDSIREMYAALRACWTPPPKDDARHGMEYTIRFAFRRDGEITDPPRRTYSSREAPHEVRDTYRDAVDEALKRCTPLHFSKGMAGAVAGRPIAIRFVDERTLAKSIDKRKSMQ
jgi:hypothetical protein